MIDIKQIKGTAHGTSNSNGARDLLFELAKEIEVIYDSLEIANKLFNERPGLSKAYIENALSKIVIDKEG